MSLALWGEAPATGKLQGGHGGYVPERCAHHAPFKESLVEERASRGVGSQLLRIRRFLFRTGSRAATANACLDPFD